MTFTYTPGGGPKDDIRFDIGDTSDAAPGQLRLEDEEINRILQRYPSRAGSRSARALAAKFARQPEGSVGPNVIRPSNRAAELRKVAEELERQESTGAIPTAGGISKSSKDAAEADTDRVQPAFTIGMLDNPDASIPDSQ
jgi:hypothetical protein